MNCCSDFQWAVSFSSKFILTLQTFSSEASNCSMGKFYQKNPVFPSVKSNVFTKVWYPGVVAFQRVAEESPWVARLGITNNFHQLWNDFRHVTPQTLQLCNWSRKATWRQRLFCQILGLQFSRLQVAKLLLTFATWLATYLSFLKGWLTSKIWNMLLPLCQFSLTDLAYVHIFGKT